MKMRKISIKDCKCLGEIGILWFSKLFDGIIKSEKWRKDDIKLIDREREIFNIVHINRVLSLWYYEIIGESDCVTTRILNGSNVTKLN